jgi:hypothetical protein
VDYDGATPPNHLEFEKAVFWIQMFDLPLACMGREMGHWIGSTVGEVEDVDVTHGGIGWEEFFRVKIWLDLSKPLSSGTFLTRRNKST